jgi:hypothetical protein
MPLHRQNSVQSSFQNLQNSSFLPHLYKEHSRKVAVEWLLMMLNVVAAEIGSHYSSEQWTLVVQDDIDSCELLRNACRDRRGEESVSNRFVVEALQFFYHLYISITVFPFPIGDRVRTPQFGKCLDTFRISVFLITQPTGWIWHRRFQWLKELGMTNSRGISHLPSVDGTSRW